jgi:hydrogenase-4 component E
MHVTIYEITGIMCAVIAVFMLGSRHIRFQLSMYTLQIWIIASSTIYYGYEHNDWHYYVITFFLVLQRAVIVPTFLEWIVKHIHVSSDPGMLIPAPLTMHLSILLFSLSFFVSQHLPMPAAGSMVTATATASLSHIFSGLLLMLTRRLALSQIIGFLTLENGIILFALTQTAGLPWLIELAVFVDILGAVMIAGLLVFNIKKSFEHIDVSRLTDTNH